VTQERNMNNEQRVIKTVLVEGVGWPRHDNGFEQGKLPHRFKHAYVKPVRVIKSGREKGRETDIKFEEWLKRNS
jgi:hypothetical protein